jgi:uncharacterized protein (DUF488 family)
MKAPIKTGNLIKQKLRIWTVGHSTRDLASFLDLLIENRIEALADVRSHPGSRRYPHFNAETMHATLAENDIEYIPFRQLGGRRRPRPDSTNTIWRNKAFRGYADYMETAEFSGGIDRLLKIAPQKRTAIMCAEAVWWRCHRSMISDYLKALGVTVVHIMGPGKNVIHPFTSAAKTKDGMLVYGAAEAKPPENYRMDPRMGKKSVQNELYLAEMVIIGKSP